PTTQGKSKVNHFIKPLIDNNWLIVSGMARGIDTYAHEATLKFKGNTISVLGSGFNHIYPKENKNLYEEIKYKGLIITEYTTNTKPELYHYPERNSIITYLAKDTIVLKSGERSVTLITLDQTLEQGKEVYVVPGNLFS